MIRSADEILKENMPFGMLFESVAIYAIKVAQREAIEASAEVAKSEWIRWGEHYGHAVEKQSILNLLNEVK